MYQALKSSFEMVRVCAVENEIPQNSNFQVPIPARISPGVALYVLRLTP